MIFKFKCISYTHPSFDEVWSNKKFKGCTVGNPVVVPGNNSGHAEEKLFTIKEALTQIPGSEIKEDKFNSFTIEIPTKEVGNGSSKQSTGPKQTTNKSK